MLEEIGGQRKDEINLRGKGVSLWSRLNWLRTGYSDICCETGYEFALRKRRWGGGYLDYVIDCLLL